MQKVSNITWSGSDDDDDDDDDGDDKYFEV